MMTKDMRLKAILLTQDRGRTGGDLGRHPCRKEALAGPLSPNNQDNLLAHQGQGKTRVSPSTDT